MNVFALTVRGWTLDGRRQILTYKVDPRALRFRSEKLNDKSICEPAQ